MDKKPPHYNLDANDVYSRLGLMWFRMPKYFLYLLDVEDNDEQHRHVPASFIKYFLVLWHEIEQPRREKCVRHLWWTASLSMRQFHVRPNDALKWTVAIEQSNLFRVEWGTYQNRKASRIRYNANANSTDWKGFYLGLMAACAEEVKGKKTASREEWAAIVRSNVARETALLIADEGGEASRWP